MTKYLIPLVLLVTLALPLAYQSTPTEIIKLKTFDAFVPDKEPSGYFTILNITDKDLEKYLIYFLKTLTILFRICSKGMEPAGQRGRGAGEAPLGLAALQGHAPT